MVMNKIWVIAVMEEVPPTFISFLKLNSSPKLNSKKITPISAHTSTLFISVIEGKKSKWFPAKNPAIRYPKTRGCFIFLNNKTAIPAVIRINPRSLIKGCKWCVLSAAAFKAIIKGIFVLRSLVRFYI